jgi:hypothetical protein
VTTAAAWVPARAVGRVGSAGRERPVVHLDGRWFDARPFTDDIDPELLGSDGMASLFDAADAGHLPVTSIEGDRIGPPVLMQLYPIKKK